MSTWKRVVPEQSRKGDLIEHGSLECQERIQYRWVNLNPKIDWVCEQDFIKLRATYSGGQTYEKDCDGNTALTTGDTNPSGYEYSAMTTAIIGDCVNSISAKAFYAFYSLTSVTIPNSVTGISQEAFQSCKRLTSVIIPIGVTRIKYRTFRDCTSLTGITIPNSVTEIGEEAFYWCSSLKNVTIPTSVTDISEDAFTNCSSLESVTCLATTPPDLYPFAFTNTNNCPIYVPANSVNAYKSATNWSTYASRIQAIP